MLNPPLLRQLVLLPGTPSWSPFRDHASCLASMRSAGAASLPPLPGPFPSRYAVWHRGDCTAHLLQPGLGRGAPLAVLKQSLPGRAGHEYCAWFCFIKQRRGGPRGSRIESGYSSPPCLRGQGARQSVAFSRSPSQRSDDSAISPSCRRTARPRRTTWPQLTCRRHRCAWAGSPGRGSPTTW